jgi:redox-sensitive bicupin YhaK (pirin superfamily)
MIERRPYARLPGDERDWLNARRHIPFAMAHGASPDRWGALQGWSDDEIAAHGGFPPHPHANTEIVTYVYEGMLTHQDNFGNIGHTRAGDVQVMSAGSGIRHAEYNLQETVSRSLQISFAPDRVGGAPAWATKPFPKADRADQFVVLASGYREDAGALPIRARARVIGATLRAGSTLQYSTRTTRSSYLVATRGRLDVNGVRLEKGDGAAIRKVSAIVLNALIDSEVVLAEVPVDDLGAVSGHEKRMAAERTFF